MNSFRGFWNGKLLNSLSLKFNHTILLKTLFYFSKQDVVVTFDGTVRDGGNNVIQFRYGDDGLDPCQAAFLKKDGLEFFAENAELLASRWSCPADPEVNQRLMNEHSLAPHLVKDIDEMAVRRMSVS